jgi:hypothetical protein
LPQGAVVIAYPNGEAFALARKLFKIKRRVTRVVPPEPVILYRETLNGFR